jgi:conjugative relaxase-like TrwC/TraI family protein
MLFAIDDDHVARQLLASHERAVDQALDYLEGEACWTRRDRDGVDCLRGEGFIATSYRHRMSRAGDPQLHTHVVVADMTCADGRYTALDARWLYAHKSAAGAVALQRHMRQTESELLALDHDQLCSALTTAPLPAPLTAPTQHRWPTRMASGQRPIVTR